MLIGRIIYLIHPPPLFLLALCANEIRDNIYYYLKNNFKLFLRYYKK
jgi:hypothetical protein